jgi:hypothetical protein
MLKHNDGLSSYLSAEAELDAMKSSGSDTDASP